MVCPQRGEPAVRVAILGGYLIDGTGRDPVRDCTLLIEGKHIAGVLPGGDARGHSASAVIDAGGRTVIPGLINCHVHLEMNAGPSPLTDLADEPAESSLVGARARAAAMLRRGITTLRDCGARGWQVIGLRAAIEQGLAPGPRILACGRALCARGGHAQVVSEPVSGEIEVAEAARRQLRAGTDFIKVMATGGFGKDGEQLDHCELGVEELRAAAEVAHGAGKKLAVHAYGNQGIRNAIAGGADTVEHATFIDDETLALLRRSGTFIVPTLTNTYRVATEGARGGVAPYICETATAVWPAMLGNARRAHRAGVRMAVGTDAGSWLNPHTDIVTELRLRIEAGVAPLEAIAMATLHSAECLGIAGMVGTLEPGKLADVVIVDGDPLEDVGALARVHAVFREGAAVPPA
ncbi:MAG: amidohydrolase family protein [Candidatus Rokubacteria bacterium]|nr:amidohydrolase family protein [Candidatus Rokubacteria bacterium]